MRKEIIVRMQPESDKSRNKALKVATSVGGIESVTMTGSGKDLLLVIGDVDEVELIKKLKDEVGAAEIMELRTLPGDTLGLPPGAPRDFVVTQSPYQQWRHSTPVRNMPPGGGRTECPVAAAAAARWPGEHSRQVGYYNRTPSPLQHHYPSPMAGGGYGYAGSSSYALAVARSHPTHYSPMIARHDFRAVGRTSPSGGEQWRQHAGGGPNCCSIL